MAEVKVIVQCVTPYGNHMPGDIIRTSDDFARHLVDVARCAEFTSPVRPSADPEAISLAAELISEDRKRRGKTKKDAD